MHWYVFTGWFTIKFVVDWLTFILFGLCTRIRLVSERFTNCSPFNTVSLIGCRESISFQWYIVRRTRIINFMRFASQEPRTLCPTTSISFIGNQNERCPHGRRLRGLGGTVPQSLRWEGRPMYSSPIIYVKHVMHNDENTLCTLTLWSFANAFRQSTCMFQMMKWPKKRSSEYLGGKTDLFSKKGLWEHSTCKISA